MLSASDPSVSTSTVEEKATNVETEEITNNEEIPTELASDSPERNPQVLKLTAHKRYASEPISPRTTDPQYRVFGVDLSQVLNNERRYLKDTQQKAPSTQQSIPELVTTTVEYLRATQGFKAPGIFRQCGKHAELMIIQEEVDSGIPLTLKRLEGLDVHTVGDILKTFLRMLPNPIIPVEEFYESFLLSSVITAEKQYWAYLGSILQVIPPERRALLQYLCQFCNQIIEYSLENKMGASNLAIIFAPSIFGQSETPDSAAIVMEAKATAKIVQSFIENYNEIFRHSYPPLQVLTATQNYKENDIVIKKGDIIRCFMLKVESEHCFIIVRGKLEYVPYSLVISKTSAISKKDKGIGIFTSKKEKEELVRNRVLQILIESQKSAGFSPTVLIDAGASAVEERGKILAEAAAAAKERQKEKQKPKGGRGHSRRRSVGDYFSFGKKDEIPDAATQEKKEKKEKKERERKEKRINSTVDAWYNSQANKSSGSFFANFKSKDLISRKDLVSKKDKDYKKDKRFKQKRPSVDSGLVNSTPSFPTQVPVEKKSTGLIEDLIAAVALKEQQDGERFVFSE